jgi:hypothetical protein
MLRLVALVRPFGMLRRATLVRPSGILRRVALVRTDFSEELSASINRMRRIDELGATRRNIPEDAILK